MQHINTIGCAVLQCDLQDKVCITSVWYADATHQYHRLCSTSMWPAGLNTTTGHGLHHFSVICRFEHRLNIAWARTWQFCNTTAPASVWLTGLNIQHNKVCISYKSEHINTTRPPSLQCDLQVWTQQQDSTCITSVWLKDLNTHHHKFCNTTAPASVIDLTHQHHKACITSVWLTDLTIQHFFPFFLSLALHCPLREIRIAFPDKLRHSSRKSRAISVPISVWSVFVCPNNGIWLASVWYF